MERPAKRRKFGTESGASETFVTRPDQLHQWLEFRQKIDPVVKDGIYAFKDHLLAISRLEDVAEQSKQLRIIKEYCEWQKAPDESQLDFHDVLSTWALAVDNNAEAVLSAIPATLAQFFRTISGTLELRPFGLALVDSLLRRDQSKLFEKCLSSPRSKPHLASPCLRLMTEMFNFDAGARANEIWVRRDLFMYKLDALLEQQNSNPDLEERRKPSVRRMALRLVLAMLKYLPADAKTALLSQARVLHAVLRGLLLDGDDIVCEIAQSLRRDLLSDVDIPRPSIAKFFHSAHLESLAALYNFELGDDDGQGVVKDTVRGEFHKLLLQLCTTDQGVLLPDHGWYPPTSIATRFQIPEDDYIDLGLDSPLYHDDYATKVPVTNTVLSIFLQRLKPNGDILQSQLCSTTLRAAPELVADYFSNNRSLPIASSEDAAWRSDFAFLFSVIESPVPKAFGWRKSQQRDPPPVAIAVESTLPKPLDRAYLNRLLSSQDDVLKISGARVLTVALKKLGRVLSMFSQLSDINTYIWRQASGRLSNLVASRMPALREVLLALQHTPHTSAASYTALLECIALYNKLLPSVTAASTFDIGPIMAQLCSIIEERDSDLESSASVVEQLAYAVQIAELSSSTKWLLKANNDTLSPLSQVLKVMVQMKSGSETQIIAQILRRTLIHRGVLSSNPQAFVALHNSLETTEKFSPSSALLLFIDNCVTRANQKPVRYLDEIESASRLVSDKKPLSLFVGAISEQWSFACKKHDGSKSIIKNIASWVARVFSLLDSAGENYRVMKHFHDNMVASSTGRAKEYLQAAIDKVHKKPITIETELVFDQPVSLDHDQGANSSDALAPPVNELINLTKSSTAIPDSLQSLDKWPSFLDIEVEVQTHRLQRLILCLSSPDDEIRLQAFQLVQAITHTVDTSCAYEGKSQIYLLLGELIETVRQYGLSQAVPTLIPELTNSSLEVLLQPTHRLYAKVNKFLLHAPVWTPKRTVTYWLEKILLREPDVDDTDAFVVEVQWLLGWLLNSLRNEIDLNLYRRSELWERVLSLYASPVVTQEIRLLILSIIWGGCEVRGGADMLWTRFGVFSWLQGMVFVDAENARALQTLQKKMMAECDGRMIETWKITCSLNRAKKPDAE